MRTDVIPARISRRPSASTVPCHVPEPPTLRRVASNPGQESIMANGTQACSRKTIKCLCGLSGNPCAFPGCYREMVILENTLDGNISYKQESRFICGLNFENAAPVTCYSESYRQTS